MKVHGKTSPVPDGYDSDPDSPSSESNHAPSPATVSSPSATSPSSSQHQQLTSQQHQQSSRQQQQQQQQQPQQQQRSSVTQPSHPAPAIAPVHSHSGHVISSPPSLPYLSHHPNPLLSHHPHHPHPHHPTSLSEWYVCQSSGSMPTPPGEHSPLSSLGHISLHPPQVLQYT